MEKNDIGFLLSKYRVQIMGVATLWIMMFHAWHPIFGEYRIIGDLEEFLKRTGFCGVDIFLLVSGFGLVHAINRYDLVTFYKRRFWNVYPPFLFAAFGIGFFRGWGICDILKKVTFVTFFVENMYGYLWYVPAILLFYLFFPIYYGVFLRSKNKIIFTGAAIVIWYCISIALDGVMRSDFYGMTNRIPVFLIGILVGWSRENVKLYSNILTRIAAVLMLSLGVVCAFMTTYKERYLLVPMSNCCVPNFLISISSCFLLVQVFELMERYFKHTGRVLLRILAFFGSFSLPIYCIQEYIHTDITKNIFMDSVLILDLILLICIISAGVGLHFWCEMIKTIINLIKDKL